VKLKLYYVVAICLAASIVTPAFAQSGGADTYKAKCAMCHGADGLGATPAGKAMKAASFKDPAVVKTPDAARIAIVKSGRTRCRLMPASSLTFRSRQWWRTSAHWRSRKEAETRTGQDRTRRRVSALGRSGRMGCTIPVSRRHS